VSRSVKSVVTLISDSSLVMSSVVDDRNLVLYTVLVLVEEVFPSHNWFIVSAGATLLFATYIVVCYFPC